MAVNGDGFGISWYGDHERPGLYRDMLPAWADDNLTNLCRMVRSRLFIAHVRASTMGETSRSNCHPFTNGRALYAFRFGSNGIAPTLYASEILDNGGRALASEPLCGQVNRWTALPQNVLCRLTVAGLKIDERNACSMACA